MFASPSEALLRAPPLLASSIATAAAQQPRAVVNTAFDDSMVFAALPSEVWCDDAVFLSGQRRLASENRYGRWMAVDRRVAVSLTSATDDSCMPWSVLPAVDGVVQSVALERRMVSDASHRGDGGEGVVVTMLAVGTVAGIECMLLTADTDALPSNGGGLTIRDVQHVQGSALSVRFLEFRDPETLLYVTDKGIVGSVALDVRGSGTTMSLTARHGDNEASSSAWRALYQQVSSTIGRETSALWSGLAGAAGLSSGSGACHGTFVSASYDRARRLCLVLTTCTLELWNVAASADKRRLGSMRIKTTPGAAAVGVHASHPDDPFLAVVFFSSGLRQRIQSTSLPNGSVELVVKSEETHQHPLLRSVARSALQGNTSIVYDATLQTLVIEASGVTLHPASDVAACDVVTSVQVTDEVIGITALPMDDDGRGTWEAKFVVYGPRGPLATVVRRPLCQVLSARIARAGVGVVTLAVDALGGEATARLLLEACNDTAQHHDTVLDPIPLADGNLIESCLSSLMAPSILPAAAVQSNISSASPAPTRDGLVVQFSPVVAAIRRTAVETIHNVEFTMRRSSDAQHSAFVQELEHHIRAIRSVTRKMERSLTRGGWMDTTHAATLLRAGTIKWRDLSARHDTQPFCPSTAASAQALFLKELRDGLSFLETLCQLLCVAVRAGVPDLATTCHGLATVVWVDTARQQVLTRIGLECVMRAPASPSSWCLQTVDSLATLPPVVRALAQVKRQADLPHAMRVVRAHMQLLADTGRVDDLMAVLAQLSGGGSGSVEAHVLAAWLPIDTTGQAVRRVLALLDAAPDAKGLTALEGLAEALPPKQLIDWIVAHRITDNEAQRGVLVQWLYSALARHPGASHHIGATPQGLFLYACVLLLPASAHASGGGGANRRAARQLFLELARDPAHAIDLTERLEVLRTALLPHESNSHSKPDHEVRRLRDVGLLQQKLLDGLSTAVQLMEGGSDRGVLAQHNVDAARACMRFLASQLLSEDDLCHAAQQWSGVTDCAAEVQLGVLLLHDDVAPYLDNIAATLEVILYQVQHQSEAPHRTPLDAACLVVTTYGPSMPDAFPMARCVLSYLVRVDPAEYEGLDVCCRRLLAECPHLDPAAMFVAAGECLAFIHPGQDETMQERLRFDHVLIALIEILRCPRMCTDDRTQCLEMLSSHVATVCANISSQEACEALGDVAHVLAALQHLEKTMPSTSFWVTHTSSILRSYL